MFSLDLFRSSPRKLKSGLSSRRQTRRASLDFEPLEDRRLLSVIQWTGGGDGKSWQDAKNWGGTLPGPNDWAEINSAFASQTITSSADVSVWRLTSEAPFQITAGTFAAENMLQVDNTFTISGGTLANTTVDAGTGGQGIVFTSAGGTLNGVQAACDLDLASNDGANVHIVNGLALFNATVRLGNAAGTTGKMYFDTTESLGGTDGTVLFGGSGSNALYAGNGDTLTIGAGITVRGGSGTIGGGNNTIVNMGTIAADTGGGTITINPDAFTNQGTLQVGSWETMNVTGLTGNLNAASLSGSGASLSVSGANWVNNEALSVPQEGTLNLGGSWTNDSPITADEAVVNLTGAWTNSSTITATNSVLRLGDPSSSSTNAWSNTGTIDAPNSWVGLGGRSPSTTSAR